MGEKLHYINYRLKWINNLLTFTALSLFSKLDILFYQLIIQGFNLLFYSMQIKIVDKLKNLV